MRRAIASAVLAAVFAFPAAAAALSSGIWHFARPESGSCGNCHGLSGGSGPVPLLVIDGLPEAYDPEGVYDLTVYVLGPELPFAGLNVEVTGGRLAALPPELPEGGVPQVGLFVNECLALERDGGCRTCPTNDTACEPAPCEVRLTEDCPVYGPDHRSCSCRPEDLEEGQAGCRPCDSETIVSAQATHTAPALLPLWRLRWTAPSCEFGKARFHLAGNSVSGSGSNDPADLWGVFAEPLAVPCRAATGIDD
jgi:hypothetical protein